MRSGLRIVRATSVEHLVVDLADRLVSEPPPDPMARIEVAVPSRGMERWLTQRLACELGATDGQGGACANIAFPFPGGLVGRLLAAVLGDAPDGNDPWAPERLAWPVLDVLTSLPGDDVHAPLRAHLAEEAGGPSRRRYPLARRIADLFDRYALYRPEMVTRWAEGADVDAEGRPLREGVAWQAPVWRQVMVRTGAPSPEARFRAAIEILQADEAPWPEGGEPGPVTVFGVAGLPELHLELLRALADRIEVCIYAVTPCPRWGATPVAPQHPILVSCAMAAAAGHGGLGALGTDLVLVGAPDEGRSTPVARPGTALGVLQRDVHDDRRRGRPGDEPPVVLAPGDRSVQIHAAHGPMRELEVLREVLYGLLQDDPTLEPRDIAVLTPDVAAYAPLARAVFSQGDSLGGRGDPDGGAGVPALPLRVADRTVRDDNAVARVLLDLLGLVTARVTASSVLDLLRSSPVRARFGLSAADLATLPGWLASTGIRWGIDADHRADTIGLSDPAHTWQAGLDRLALGVAMADDGERTVGGVRPFDDVEGGAVELVARLATVTDLLFSHLRSLRTPRPVERWNTALAAVLDDLLDPGPEPGSDADLAWQLAAVREALTVLVEQSRGSSGEPSTVPLTLDEVRAALESGLGGRASRAAYGTGAITLAGLEPLRNVPHRVVCLVGLDDGALPRSSSRPGFDLLASQPRPGDPDPRVEDRQLFLDAVLAARETLVVTYSGRDPRTNELQQPAVPVAEVLDVLEATLTVVGVPPSAVTPAVRDRLVTAHPLQPYSAAYFRPSPADPELTVVTEGGTGRDPARVPQAFDRRQLAAATAANGPVRTPPAFLPPGVRLPTTGTTPGVVDLDDLIRFLTNPVRHLLQHRLGLWLGEDDLRPDDRDPTELGPLQRWQLGEELLARHRQGNAPDRWRATALASGTVPAGTLGTLALADIEAVTAAMWARVAGVQESIAVDLAVPLPLIDPRPTTWQVVGSVDLSAGSVTHVGVSRIRDRHRIACWARLLAVTAQEPDRAPSAQLLGRDSQLAAGYREVTLPPVAAPDDGSGASAADVALAHLGGLVDLYRRGSTEPVALLPAVTRAYTMSRLTGRGHAEAVEAARPCWEGTDQDPGEQVDPYVVQAFGAGYDVTELADRPGFATDALAVWTPVLVAEGSR